MPRPSDEDMAWLEDLERCDGFAPCGECDRCTEGGRPWKTVRKEWLASFGMADEDSEG